jgi:hypothetical protein
MQLLQTHTELSGSEKKEILLKVLQDICAGNDGILGTDDDLLPAETVKMVQQLLQGNLVHDIIDVFSGLLKGQVHTNKAKGIAMSCMPMIQILISKLKFIKRNRT